jgi:hypothetical protein
MHLVKAYKEARVSEDDWRQFKGKQMVNVT